VPSYVGAVEDPAPEKLGVCCSGGGIRSAAFSLGALQTLQEEKELRRARYLAAVSGGSYIAAALAAVAKDRGENDSDPELLGRLPPFAPGSPEEQYLRNRCSYLAPTLTDKIYVGFRILLGMVINLVFVSLPLIGLTLLLAAFFFAPQLPDLVGTASTNFAADIPAWFWVAPLVAVGLAALLGWIGMLFKLRHDKSERILEAWATRLLLIGLLSALVLVALPTIVDLMRPDGLSGPAAVAAAPTESAQATGDVTSGKTSVGLLTLLAGIVAGIGSQLWQLLRSHDGREEATQVVKGFEKLGGGVRKGLAYLAGGVLGPLVPILAVVAALSVGLEHSSHGFRNWGVALAGCAFLAAFTIFYLLADLTTWSLHPFYKRRLSSVFSLKRVRASNLTEEERKRVEAISGPGDAQYKGIAVERNFDKSVPLSETPLDDAAQENPDKRSEWPTLLVCAAANISDIGATPPGRRVTSFTFSAHAVGGPLVGAVKTTDLESAFDPEGSRWDGRWWNPFWRVRSRAAERRRRDLTLLAAVAMSGAAISPSMGKMTPRPLTLLMALANLRLGVWVPNPRWVAGTEDRRRYRRPRPSYLFRELLGRNGISAKYLYVTDGGHYENLGLVELLRRGCTQIYCFDASGVGEGRAEFEALGDAIALARSELDVEIEFKDDPDDLAPQKAASSDSKESGEAAPSGKLPVSKRQTAKGTIEYPDGTRGTLIYVRNVMTKDAPWDAKAYQKVDHRFPNNNTIDQLYTDQKFEAYRVLGRRAAAEAVEQMPGSQTGRRALC
jgi:hypothetical protein